MLLVVSAITQDVSSIFIWRENSEIAVFLLKAQNRLCEITYWKLFPSINQYSIVKENKVKKIISFMEVTRLPHFNFSQDEQLLWFPDRNLVSCEFGGLLIPVFYIFLIRRNIGELTSFPRWFSPCTKRKNYLLTYFPPEILPAPEMWANFTNPLTTVFFFSTAALHLYSILIICICHSD